MLDHWLGYDYYFFGLRSSLLKSALLSIWCFYIFWRLFQMKPRWTSSRVKLVNKIGEIICTQSRREMFVLWDLENQALNIGKHVFDGNFGPYMQKFLVLQFQLKPSGHAHQDVACDLVDLVFVWVFWCFPLNWLCNFRHIVLSYIFLSPNNLFDLRDIEFTTRGRSFRSFYFKIYLTETFKLQDEMVKWNYQKESAMIRWSWS